MAQGLKTGTPLGELVLRFSGYSLKRVSLTGLAESDVGAVRNTAEPRHMIFSVTFLVKLLLLINI